MLLRVLLCCIISASAFADTQTTVQEQAHMKEKADRWFEKFLKATPEKQAAMLERRNNCLKLPKEERQTACHKGHSR